MPKIPREEMEARLAATEEAMVSLRSIQSVIDAMRLKYGVTDRSVYYWMNQVRERWDEEAKAEWANPLVHRASKRAEMRATLWSLLVKANKQDNVPGIRAALQAAKLIMELDGLAVASGPEATETPSDTPALTDAGKAALEAFMTSGPKN